MRSCPSALGWMVSFSSRSAGSSAYSSMYQYPSDLIQALTSVMKVVLSVSYRRGMVTSTGMDPFSSTRPISSSRFILKVATVRERLSLDPICSTVYFALGARKSVVYLFFSAVVVAPPQGSNGLTQEGIFRAAARQADLVLLSGARLHEILRNNAANFRQTKFGCIDTGIRAANIMCVTFADEQAAFLAGALLSQLHRHGLLPAPRTRAAGDELTLGWLAGEDDPQLKSMLNGFVEGVRLESPGARVINGVAGSYSSPEKGRAKAEELLGLDINALAVLAGRAGLGAVEAAIAQGRPLVGVDKDQQFLAPKLMLTSIVKRADRAVFEIVKATARGAFAGNEIITYDLANGGVDIVSPQVWARHAGVRLPAAIERRLAELRLELTRGGIRLPSLRDRTLCNCR